jgi:hypothetical protein
MKPITDPTHSIPIFLGSQFNFNFKLTKNQLHNPRQIIIVIGFYFSYIYDFHKNKLFRYIYKKIYE